jgi:hypothetical protein
MMMRAEDAERTSINRRSGEAGRSFGLMLAAILFAIGTYRWWQGFSSVGTLTILAAGMVSAAVSLLCTALFDPVARVWLRFGDILGMIVSPVILVAIFFLIITPVAIVTRLFGRDELRLKRLSGTSYWVVREPPRPHDNSFESPF